MVDQRRVVRVLQFDPVIIRFLANYEPFQQFVDDDTLRSHLLHLTRRVFDLPD